MVERERPVEVPVYVDKFYDRVVEVPYNVEVEKPIYVDKVVERRVEVPYERVV